MSYNFEAEVGGRSSPEVGEKENYLEGVKNVIRREREYE